jgi:replicative DNA helicase
MFIEAITEAVDKAGDPDDVSDVIQNLQGRLNQITYIGNGTVLRDLFSSEVSERMVEEIRLRRSGKGFGLPTGFTKLDATIGGMQRKRLITVMGRPGLGKSWLDLLFVANAVMAGGSFTLYPLEMTLEETAFRLYTLFTSRIFGVEKALKNFDLLSGRISPKKVVRFLDALENKFAGQLYVADVGSIGDPYTPERVEADQELHPTDGFWVDYIGLMRVPREYQENETSSITRLCAGLKQTAQRKDCIGGCSAQINRDALKVNAFIPRIEHIYGGDGLGQFSDQCVSINRRGKYLFYGLVKNRHGPEFGRTRVRFFVNEGYIAEDIREDDDED